MATLAELDPRCIIPNPRNPRFELPQLQDLMASIQAVGVLQPIVVFPDNASPDSSTLDPDTTGFVPPNGGQM
jgi:ParB-like chromosome segregation protein Spo0J